MFWTSYDQYDLKFWSLLEILVSGSCHVEIVNLYTVLDQFIKVQIRQDLALDVSAVPTDATLSALPAEAATPVLPVAKLGSKPPLTPHTLQTRQALVEISNKTVTFPTTTSGETSGRMVHN